MTSYFIPVKSIHVKNGDTFLLYFYIHIYIIYIHSIEGTKSKEGAFDNYLNSWERFRYLSRTDAFSDVRSNFHQKKKNYKIHKQRSSRRLARIVKSVTAPIGFS